MIKYNDTCSNQVHKASQKFWYHLISFPVIHQTESSKWHLDYAICQEGWCTLFYMIFIYQDLM